MFWVQRNNGEKNLIDLYLFMRYHEIGKNMNKIVGRARMESQIFDTRTCVLATQFLLYESM